MKTSEVRPVASRRGSTAQLAWLLVGDVADLLEGGLDNDSIRWLLPVLESLRGLMDAEAQEDAAAGFMGDVVAQFPNSYERVTALQEMHNHLHSELHVFVHQLSKLADQIAVNPDVRLKETTMRMLKLRLVSWVDRMSAQHRNERELSQSVWYLELGAGD